MVFCRSAISTGRVEVLTYHVDVRVVSSHADYGFGELRLDSAERALETALISKGSSRSAIFPIVND